MKNIDRMSSEEFAELLNNHVEQYAQAPLPEDFLTRNADYKVVVEPSSNGTADSAESDHTNNLYDFITKCGPQDLGKPIAMEFYNKGLGSLVFISNKGVPFVQVENILPYIDEVSRDEFCEFIDPSQFIDVAIFGPDTTLRRFVNYYATPMFTMFSEKGRQAIAWASQVILPLFGAMTRPETISSESFSVMISDDRHIEDSEEMSLEEALHVTLEKCSFQRAFTYIVIKEALIDNYEGRENKLRNSYLIRLRLLHDETGRVSVPFLHYFLGIKENVVDWVIRMMAEERIFGGRDLFLSSNSLSEGASLSAEAALTIAVATSTSRGRLAREYSELVGG